MHATVRARLAVLCATIGACACTTTGDPRQGGLFGWSEAKAEARQDELKQNEADAQRQAASEQQRSTALRGQQAGLGAEAAWLQAELDRLLAENNDLDSKLRDLMKRRQLGDAETARLRKVLADNERFREAARQAPASVAVAPAATRVNAANEQNGRLHREVMILLQ